MDGWGDDETYAHRLLLLAVLSDREVSLILDRPAWHADAACAEPDVDQGVFFPARGVSLSPAVAVCGRCLVRDECLAHALADPSLQGVWGGTSDRQRSAIRRERAA